MKLLTLLPFILGLGAAQQVPLEVSKGHVIAITPEVKQFAKEVLHNGSVPGLTLGVVHSNGHVEFEAFGKKTEDGANMTIDVSLGTSHIAAEYVNLTGHMRHYSI